MRTILISPLMIKTSVFVPLRVFALQLSKTIAFLLFCATTLLQSRRANLGSPLIIGYLPSRSRGWILEFIFRDLAVNAKICGFTLCDNPISVVLELRKSNKAFVLSMHQSFVPELIQSGIPGSSLISIYTHSRINSALSSADIGKVRKWLPMNSSEAGALLMAGARPERIQVFPIGYDSNLFNDSNTKPAVRDIDVLFAGRFVDHRNSHYHARKNYGLILPVVESLIADGFVVGILGRDWERLFAHLAVPPLIFDLPFASTPSIYRRSKVLLNLSLLEGGPVSWLEGMATGCVTISCPSGFPLDHINSNSGSYLLSPRPSLEEVLSAIARILGEYDRFDPRDFCQSRKTFLDASSFSTLCGVLESMIS